MTLTYAIHKASTFYELIGKNVKHIKNGKLKKISRITAYKKEENDWDVAVFFEGKNQAMYSQKPNCFIDQFLKEYFVPSDMKLKDHPKEPES